MEIFHQKRDDIFHLVLPRLSSYIGQCVVFFFSKRAAKYASIADHCLMAAVFQSLYAANRGSLLFAPSGTFILFYLMLQFVDKAAVLSTIKKSKKYELG